MEVSFRRHQLTLAFIFILIAFTALGKVQQRGSATGALIQGTVKSGQVPLPGVAITATLENSSTVVAGSTDVNGRFQIRVAGPGKYTVLADLTAFAAQSHEVNILDPTTPSQIDFDLPLASRVPKSAAAPVSPPVRRPPAAAAAAGAEAAAPATDETVVPDLSADTAPPPDLAVAGMDPNAATESVVSSGTGAQPSFNGLFDPNGLAAFQNGDFGGPGGPGGGQGGRGGPGGGGGGRGGPGGGGRGGGFAFGGQRGRINPNKPNINLSYTLADSAFNAAPYSLSGTSQPKEQYVQNRYTATIGGPLVIPHVINDTKDNYNISYSGSRLTNPVNNYSTVPTLLERQGNFSQSIIRSGAQAGQPVQIFDPATGLPFANETLPSINPAAAGLLAYIPLPNQPTATQNYLYQTTTTSQNDNVNVRFNHTFGTPPQRGQRGNQRGAGGGGGRGGGRGGGNGRTTLTFGFQYQRQYSNQSSSPYVGGTTYNHSMNIPLGFNRSFGRLSSNTQLQVSRTNTNATNLYAFNQNIEGALGIAGVSTNPFDWGLPGLTFTNYSGLNDIHPALRINQTTALTQAFVLPHGKHTLRFGGDYRWLQVNNETDSNGRGGFTFSGASTTSAGIAGSGYDFADFLLGLPQLTTLQSALNNNNSYHFRGTSWDGYVTDDYRFRSHLTFNLGLRYEFFSPYTETQNRIVNLDVNPSFTAVAPVLPGQTSPYSGVLPRGLLFPDHNNFAPRVALAWSVKNTVVRAGYGINYSTSAYQTMVQQFAFQPPFSMTETNTTAVCPSLTLLNGFPGSCQVPVTNNYAVDPHYKLGYAQQWNLDVQRQIPFNLVMNLDYTGIAGVHQDVVEAPNRTATGIRIPGVEAFQYETSGASSNSNSGQLRLSRRLQKGMQIAGSYIWSKSIDNASTVGGAAGNSVAQDAFNLRAERALSTFDRRQRFTGTYLWQLPFGHDRALMTGTGPLQAIFGDWQLSGDWNVSSGSPYTARVVSTAAEIAQGINGTLRANVTGVPVNLSSKSIPAWFNKSAFVAPPAGTFGNAGRNTIIGPGTHTLDASLNKSIPMKDSRNLDIRIAATNVLNNPQWTAIDTTVNSPTFGRVTSVGGLRTVQFITRFRF